MQEKIFEVDPRIWNLDDAKVQAMKNGILKPEEFMRIMRPDDPYEFINGVLTYLTPEDQEKRRNSVIASNRQLIKSTGGLYGRFLFDHKKEFLEVYPELSTIYEDVENIIKKENCVGCAQNQHTQKIVSALIALPKENRKIELLSKLFETGKLPYAEKFLKGIPLTDDDITVTLPAFFTKRLVNTLENSSHESISPLAENSSYLLRESCMDCVRKHLSQAQILMKEILFGYDEEHGYVHKSLLIGHLAEAADEALKEDVELAKRIRELRTTIMNQKTGPING